MISVFGSNSFGTAIKLIGCIILKAILSPLVLPIIYCCHGRAVTIQFLYRFLDSLEIWKMKSGVHSLCIGLFLLVNRQESKQGTGTALRQ